MSELRAREHSGNASSTGGSGTGEQGGSGTGEQGGSGSTPGETVHPLCVLGVVVPRHVEHDVPQQLYAALAHTLHKNA